MIISISGAQSTGKSTLIKALDDKGFNVLHHSSARYVMSEMGITLQDMKGNTDLVIEFQTELATHKYEIDSSFKSDEINFVERSLIDLAANAICLNPDKYSDKTFVRWLGEYVKDIIKAQVLYDFNIVLPSRVFDYVDDGTRADVSSQFNIDIMIRQLYIGNEFSYKAIVSESVENRVSEIEEIIKGLQNVQET